jgi:hypothetical protein
MEAARDRSSARGPTKQGHDWTDGSRRIRNGYPDERCDVQEQGENQ